MIAASDELVTALAQAQEADEAVRASVRQAKQLLGTEEEERAMKAVRICQRERDRATERVVEVRQRTPVTA